MEAVEHGLGRGVGVRIEHGVRVGVALQEALQPDDIGLLGVTDDDRAARAFLQQCDATQDQSAHDPLAEVCLGHQQRPQLLRRDHEGIDRTLGHRVHQHRPAG